MNSYKLSVKKWVEKTNSIGIISKAGRYGVETKRINEAVKNNPDKFPNRFSWVLNDADLDNLWSKNATANISSKSRVFTEQGVYMLSTQVSII